MTIGPERLAASAGIAVRKLSVWLSGKESTIATSPTISASTAAASATEPDGSLHLRTNGDLSQRISGTWRAVLTGGRASRIVAPFKSTVQTGNGSAQSVAHGLGVVPSLVMIIGYDLTGGAYVVTEGTHTSTNVVVTVTNGEKYVVIAYA
jgi:hypothetical protein